MPGRRTTTDLEGTFRLNGLDPGLYTIIANAPAYTTEPAPAYVITVSVIRCGWRWFVGE